MVLADFKLMSEDDWRGYEGAESFTNGMNPLISEIRVGGFDTDVIIDNDGVEIYLINDISSEGNIRFSLKADVNAVIFRLKRVMTLRELFVALSNIPNTIQFNVFYGQ